MCVVIDACCFGLVFDGHNKKHPKFVPVLNWINGTGYMIYGGTKYNDELAKASRFLPYITELSKKRRTIKISNATVDPIAADLKTKITDPNFNDEHLLALVIASRCRVVCTNDNIAIFYLKGIGLLGYDGITRPRIYRGHKNHRNLCSDEHVVGICRGRP